MKKDATKLADQVAATMAMEGMKLKKTEYNRLVRCASGKQSTTSTIQRLIAKYKVTN